MPSPRLLARLVAGLAAGGLATVALPARPALAQSPREQAEQLNNEGKDFLNAQPMQPADAADRFQKAIDLVPDGRYYANLCLALYHVGKLGEALTACKAVSTHGGDARAVKQADNLMEKAIKPRMREAGIDPDAPPPNPDGGNGGNGGDGNNGNGGNGGDGNNGGNGTGNTGQPDASNFTVAPPPSLLDQKAAPKHEYTWTLGGQLLGSSVKYGFKDAYDSSGAGFRVTGDYLLMPQRGVGVVGYLQATQVAAGVLAESLSVVDLGVGVYKDFCTGHVCVKPVLGLGFALFQTELMSASGSDSLVGLSARGEVTGAYAFGPRLQHLITASVGYAGYTQPVGEYENDPEAYGLDEPGNALYLGVGYTHRFDTPFGQSPFFVVQ